MATHTRMVNYTVEGTGIFPFDMLRYDSAWPQHETDSGLIEASTRRSGGLLRVHLTGLRKPTDRRWESFGWKVDPHSVKDSYLEWRSRTR